MSINYCTQYDISRAGMNLTWTLENPEQFTFILVSLAIIPLILIVLKLWKKWSGWVHVVVPAIVVWGLVPVFYNGELAGPIGDYNVLISSVNNSQQKVIEGQVKSFDLGKVNTFTVNGIALNYAGGPPRQGLTNEHINGEHLQNGQQVRLHYVEGVGFAKKDNAGLVKRTITKLEIECQIGEG